MTHVVTLAEELNDAFKELNGARIELAKYYSWHFAKGPVKSEMIEKEAAMLKAKRKYDILRAALKQGDSAS